MTKPKAWLDLDPSLDADWPHQRPTTIADLVAEARAVEWDFAGWCYASGYDATNPDARRFFDCLLATMLKTLIIATVLLPTLAIAQRSQQLPQPRQPGQWCPTG